MISGSKINRKVQIVLILISGLVVLYFMVRPTYEIKVLKLGSYPYTPITQMIYSGFFDRKLLYIYGNYQTETYPNKNYIVLDDFSGFDSMSEIIANRDSNQKAIIYSIGGPAVYKNPTGSEKIISRQVDNGTYEQMRKNQIGMSIVAE